MNGNFLIYIHHQLETKFTMATPRKPEIRLLSPLSMQHGDSVAPMYLHIQEVIHYAESRFSAALPIIEVDGRDLEARRWMQAALKEELVFYTSIVM